VAGFQRGNRVESETRGATYLSFTRLVAVAGGVLCLSALAPLLNYLIDPFWAFGGPEIAGLNAVKPAATHRSRLSKAYSVCRVKPDIIFLGTSRAELLFDPEHPALRKRWKRPYNLAMAGSGIYEIRKLLQHAYFAAGIDAAVLALDFHMFNAFLERTVLSRTVIGYDENRLVLSPKDSCTRALLREANVLLFSAAALKESWRTVRNQDFPIIYRTNGIRDDARMNRIVLKGQSAQRNGFVGQVRAYMDHVWFPKPERRYCFSTGPQGSSVWDDFRKIVTFAREHGIRLYLVLNPEHVVLQRGIVETGLWPLYEDWRRKLVQILAEDARVHPREEPFPLWDFSGLDDVNTEPLPPPMVAASKQHMRFWYEGTHAQVEVGDRMIARIFGYHDPARKPIENFGIRIDDMNIERHLRDLRRAMGRYERDHADIIEWVKTIKKDVPSYEDPMTYCKGS